MDEGQTSWRGNILVEGVATGASAYAQFGWEDAYATKATDIDKVFGLEQKLSGIRWAQNRMTLAELGSVTVGNYAYGRSEGSLSVEWVLSTPWFLQAILNNVASTVATPDSHTFKPSKEIEPFTVEIGMDLPGTNQVRTLLGCMCRSLGIRGSIGENVRCTADVMFGKEEAVGTVLDVNPAADTDGFIPYTFEHGSIELPGGTVLAEVQSIDLNIASNAELLYGHGSPTAVNARRGLTEITGRVNMTMKDNTVWGYVNARSDIATLNLKYTNGLNGDAERSILFALTGISLDEHSIGSLEANEAIFQDFPFQAKNITATAKNDTAAVP